MGPESELAEEIAGVVVVIVELVWFFEGFLRIAILALLLALAALVLASIFRIAYSRLLTWEASWLVTFCSFPDSVYSLNILIKSRIWICLLYNLVTKYTFINKLYI